MADQWVLDSPPPWDLDSAPATVRCSFLNFGTVFFSLEKLRKLLKISYFPATTVGNSHTFVSNAMQTIDYRGPMGVMILGIQDEYKVDDPVAAVK